MIINTHPPSVGVIKDFVCGEGQDNRSWHVTVEGRALTPEQAIGLAGEILTAAVEAGSKNVLDALRS